MKILHFSDTHLGYNDLDILDENNINQREADFYDAFTQVVNQIIKIKPDFIIHTGDLFHRSSPSNRAITFALEQFKIIDNLDIPFILIAGNHSTPRTNLSSPILKIFENFKNVYASYSQEYKKIEFDDVVFHTLPHMNDDSIALDQIELCESSIDTRKKNIMMMHCTVGAWYLMNEYGEWVYPSDKEYIFEKMDYVALGHWHGFGAVSIKGTKEKYENVFYSGSLERTSLNDKRNEKGFVVLDIEDDLLNTLHVEYKQINIRPIRVKEIDCSDYEQSIQNIDSSDTLNAIVDVKLTNLSSLQSIDIQNSSIKELFPDAMSVNIKREFKNSSSDSKVEDIEALSLEEYFLEHIQDDSKKEEYDRLKNKVQELFSLYEESTNDTN
ncbi:exonuclease sbcCD subunit D [Poseidonibacter parvus]|uniref:Exonuclease sbcCD subunit D n=1 Tax=Poseidonibacter parvus TaxID=1850254 RepID=A0A1P8KMS6_9BACT|nr:DNA repair exonuclease [Poseidonibacter parvus]APW65870.1 exonuclease sbcCD subunit D [Poseidonibacter parvus]